MPNLEEIIVDQKYEHIKDIVHENFLRIKLFNKEVVFV